MNMQRDVVCTSQPIEAIDALAQEIRRLDGNHSKGAASLAEDLVAFILRSEVFACAISAAKRESEALRLLRAYRASPKFSHDHDAIKRTVALEDQIDLFLTAATEDESELEAVLANGFPMSRAPRDGEMLRLLVDFTDNQIEDRPLPSWTIGANTFDANGIDEWQIAGWCWTHDHFTQGEGTPIGWLPLKPNLPDALIVEALLAEWMTENTPTNVAPSDSAADAEVHVVDLGKPTTDAAQQ